MTELNQGPPVNRHRPSVDVLFSVRQPMSPGERDGIHPHGRARMARKAVGNETCRSAYHRANEASCVVFGMPKEAIAMGGACEVLPLQNIARRTLEYLALHNGKSNRV